MKTHNRGFTLIELSIVLVIIGLVVGGVIVGKDMIKAAEMRATLSQVDQFKVATKTFKNKYGSLPGDMHPSKATQFGFFEMTGLYMGSSSGFADDSGSVDSADSLDLVACSGECGLFWKHLSEAGLIASISNATLESDSSAYHSATYLVGTPAGENETTPLSSHLYMPAAKNGLGYFGVTGGEFNSQLANYGLPKTQTFFYINPAASADLSSVPQPSMSALDSYSIDAKIDDGKPNSGKFIGYNLSSTQIYWSDGTGLNADSIICTVGGTAWNEDDARYNTNPATGGNTISCMPIFLW